MDKGRQVFAVDFLERYAEKGRGVITCMAAVIDISALAQRYAVIEREDEVNAGSVGKLMIRGVTSPSILPEEAQEVTSWEIKPTLAKPKGRLFSYL